VEGKEDRLSKITLQEWWKQGGLQAEGRELLRSLTCGCGDSPSRMAAAGWIWQFGGGSGFEEEAMTKLLGKGMNYRIKGGLAAPVVAMAENLGSIIHFNSKVVAINQTDPDGALVMVRQSDGKVVSVKAQHVLFFRLAIYDPQHCFHTSFAVE